MKRAKDITGQRRHKLTAIRPVRKDAGGRHYWLCACACGRQTIVQVSEFGKTKSCGCQRTISARKWATEGMPWKKKMLPGDTAAFRQVLNAYTQRASRFKREWALTEAEARQLFAGSCSYCGAPPSITKHVGLINRIPFIYNSIDRIDSAGGYTLDNCQSCCHTCNVAKMDRTDEDFRQWIKRTYEYIAPSVTKAIDNAQL